LHRSILADIPLCQCQGQQARQRPGTPTWATRPQQQQATRPQQQQAIRPQQQQATHPQQQQATRLRKQLPRLVTPQSLVLDGQQSQSSHNMQQLGNTAITAIYNMRRPSALLLQPARPHLRPHPRRQLLLLVRCKPPLAPPVAGS
jgi:hypothetical protein